MIITSCLTVTQNDSEDKECAIAIALAVVLQKSIFYVPQEVCTAAAVAFDEAITCDVRFHFGENCQFSPVFAFVLGCNTHTLKLTKQVMIPPITDQAKIACFLTALEIEVPQQVKRQIIGACSV
ncbi:hypothetical protein H6F89_34465 [Cyanobacteria bacterium FACHB-63]|nr:hypothetical protein [Cyanobacteria bacterium FACHB-63]